MNTKVPSMEASRNDSVDSRKRSLSNPSILSKDQDVDESFIMGSSPLNTQFNLSTTVASHLHRQSQNNIPAIPRLVSSNNVNLSLTFSNGKKQDSAVVNTTASVNLSAQSSVVNNFKKITCQCPFQEACLFFEDAHREELVHSPYHCLSIGCVNKFYPYCILQLAEELGVGNSGTGDSSLKTETTK